MFVIQKVMVNLFKSKVCPQCGKKFDPVSASCPHCGCENVERNNREISFDKISPVGHIQEFFLALLQLVFMRIAMLGVQSLIIYVLYSKLGDQASVAAWVGENGGALNFWLSFGSDLVILAVAIAIINRKFPIILKSFKNPKFVLGIPLGIAMLLITTFWSAFASQIMPGETNANAAGLMSILDYSPIGYALFAVILAPFVEEIMYRVGLFTFLKRIHPALAYVGVGIVFGMIHMHSLTDPVEWLYFPGYAFGGLALSFIYDKFGFGASFMAHLTNNGISVLLTLMSYFAGPKA